MADLKASLCGELPNQESVIPKEQLRNLLERRGIVGDPDIPNAKARLAEQELRRNMYHNTQVMLKHYRDIVWALECFPSEVAQELDQPLKDLDALLSVVDTQVALGNAKLEHRLLSIRKSRLLLDRINEALTVLRHKPGNGELMYNIIFQTFITPDKPSHSDILYRLDISERHYYRLRQQAVNILSIRLWTAPVGCLDAWLERYYQCRRTDTRPLAACNGCKWQKPRTFSTICLDCCRLAPRLRDRANKLPDRFEP